MTPLQSDAVKFLELLLSECNGVSEHAWRRCRRCLAISHIEGHNKFARQMIKTAIDALADGNQPTNAEPAETTVGAQREK